MTSHPVEQGLSDRDEEQQESEVYSASSVLSAGSIFNATRLAGPGCATLSAPSAMPVSSSAALPHLNDNHFLKVESTTSLRTEQCLSTSPLRADEDEEGYENFKHYAQDEEEISHTFDGDVLCSASSQSANSLGCDTLHNNASRCIEGQRLLPSTGRAASIGCAPVGSATNCFLAHGPMHGAQDDVVNRDTGPGRGLELEGKTFATVADIPEDRLADTIAMVLEEFCRSNPARPDFPAPHDPAALFFSPFRQKSFSLNYYCKRLLDYTCCSKSCFVVAILYIVRLSERYPVFELNDYNVHRLICTAVVLAAKFMDDLSYSNVHYAKVGGIQTPGEMNKLEVLMLKALDYRLYVSKDNFDEVEAHITLIAASCT